MTQQTRTKRTTLSHHCGAYSASVSTLATPALMIKPTKNSPTFHLPHELKARLHVSEFQLSSWQKHHERSEHNTWYYASSEAPDPSHCSQ